MIADLVYRAISRTSYEAKRYWPKLEVPVEPQRWNRESQPTIYASHEARVAATEKLGRLARSRTLGSARAYWSATPATNEVRVLSFEPRVFCARLMDLMGRADIADYLGPGYRPSQALAEELIARDQITALRSPSAEFWPDVETNETYFVMVGAQPRREDFPDTQEDGWYVGGA